ncbi:hypothetical protein FEE95_03295 [Maribacter algarum]|uniref:Uncharacterized protein n=1 Tax=Maribacter algarum (ex Zhang et al. 2020) TaxID=2578118 RepID=A0A5S3PU46_9FLAO|nr:DUF6428 family protein [Maribacter algarum]TMM58470.1 hypothetical protein FEE95_03295 [Maribacter algarum]
MKTNELLSLLKDNPGKILLFEYKPNSFIRSNYHITEIKNITVDSVDCGAKTDFWKETIIQLWEDPNEIDTEGTMTAFKALGILNKVDSIKPMEREVEVKFEYSNPNFHMAQLFVNDVELSEDRIIMKLGVEQTDCKAKETCGVTVEASAQESNSCAPGSGCC